MKVDGDAAPRFLTKSLSQEKTDTPAVPITKDSGSREDSGSCSKSSSSAANVTPWSPPSLSRRNGGTATEQDRLETIRRGVRSSLNKLTPENFERVAIELTNVAVKSETILTSVIDLIFRKALEEPQYNSLYAQLCRRLSDNAPDKDIFKRVLLTQVQHVYLRRSNDDEDGNAASQTAATTGDSSTPRDIARRRKLEHLSNVKFIGELGKLDLLHEQILHVCIQELLERKSSPSIADKAEDLECLCQMMRIIGNSLDSRTEDILLMDDYIRELTEYSHNAQLPSRIRFLCLDIVELRSNKWIPRRIHQASAPKTITEIREEIRAEIGAAKEVDNNAPRLSPARGGNNSRQPNSPRTVAEKQEQLRNGTSPQSKYGRGDYNRTTNNKSSTAAAPAQRQTNMGDARRSVLKILRQDGDNGQEVLLRPVTSFIPQRPSQKASEAVRSLKEPVRPASVTIVKDEIAPRVEKPKPVKPPQPLSKAEFTQAMSTIITAYFDNVKDRCHAVANIMELNLQKRFKPDSIGLMLQMGMEQGETNREKISELIGHLTCELWVTENDVTEGYERLLEKLDCGNCDPKPCMAAYLADLVASGIMSFKNAVSLFDRGQHFPLVLMCLQHLEQTKGSDFLSEKISAERMDLLKLFPEKTLKMGVDVIVDTLDTYGLTYLCPSYRLQAQLGKLLVEGLSSSEIEQWLHDNVNAVFHNKIEFVFSLIISLVKHIHYQSVGMDIKEDAVEHSKVNEEKFKKSIMQYKMLFHRHLKSQENQLVGLYAVQSFYYSIGFPKGWVLRWFCMLHEFDMVEPETFNVWRDEVNDAYQGKGKALFQVNAWLEWLNTIESESDSEDPAGDNN